MHYLLFQEQIQIAKREEEKRLKRIYDNWKRLINGMLVKQKIKERYGVSSSTEKEKINKKIKQSDIDKICPDKQLKSKEKNKLNKKQKNNNSQSNKDNINDNKTDTTSQDKEDTSLSYIKPPVNLKIDLQTSSVDSYKKVIYASDKNSVSKHLRHNLSDSEDEQEHDPEEHENKVQQLISQTSYEPDLSDLSEDEKSFEGFTVSQPMCFQSKTNNTSKTNNFQQKVKLGNSSKVKKKTTNQKKNRTTNCKNKSTSSRSSSPDAFEVIKSSNRRISHRNNLKKCYKENDESESDIPIDDSDTEDKTFDPSKEKIFTKLNIQDTLDLSEESESEWVKYLS